MALGTTNIADAAANSGWMNVYVAARDELGIDDSLDAQAVRLTIGILPVTAVGPHPVHDDLLYLTTDAAETLDLIADAVWPLAATTDA